MNTSAKILFVMENGFECMRALEQSIELARKHGAKLVLLDIVESLPRSVRMLVTSVPPAELKEIAVRQRHAQIRALIRMAAGDSGIPASRVLYGNRLDTIEQEACSGQYDLLIKRTGNARHDRRLATACACPVWLLGPDGNHVSGDSVASMARSLFLHDGIATDMVMTDRSAACATT